MLHQGTDPIVPLVQAAERGEHRIRFERDDHQLRIVSLNYRSIAEDVSEVSPSRVSGDVGRPLGLGGVDLGSDIVLHRREETGHPTVLQSLERIAGALQKGRLPKPLRLGLVAAGNPGCAVLVRDNVVDDKLPMISRIRQ